MACQSAADGQADCRIQIVDQCPIGQIGNTVEVDITTGVAVAGAAVALFQPMYDKGRHIVGRGRARSVAAEYSVLVDVTDHAIGRLDGQTADRALQSQQEWVDTQMPKGRAAISLKVGC